MVSADELRQLRESGLEVLVRDGLSGKSPEGAAIVDAAMWVLTTTSTQVSAEDFFAMYARRMAMRILEERAEEFPMTGEERKGAKWSELRVAVTNSTGTICSSHSSHTLLAQSYWRSG